LHGGAKPTARERQLAWERQTDRAPMSASVKFLLPYDRGGNHIALPENSPLGPLWVESGRYV